MSPFSCILEMRVILQTGLSFFKLSFGGVIILIIYFSCTCLDSSINKYLSSVIQLWCLFYQIKGQCILSIVHLAMDIDHNSYLENT